MGYRGILCQTEAMATHRNPIWQAPPELHRLHQKRKHHAMAQMIKLSLQPRAFSIHWEPFRRSDFVRGSSKATQCVSGYGQAGLGRVCRKSTRPFGFAIGGRPPPNRSYPTQRHRAASIAAPDRHPSRQAELTPNRSTGLYIACPVDQADEWVMMPGAWLGGFAGRALMETRRTRMGR